MELYSAFISYSHADASTARWLHHGIEGFRFPKTLIGEDSEFGPIPRKLPRVFRDREELPASADLGSRLNAALRASRFQIVICTPRAAKSRWVNEEILSFKRMHGEGRTLALIAGGEPHSGGEDECFPPALRFHLGPDGTLSDDPAEPIAADIRPGKDGRRLALLKLLSGIAGVPLDSLARRDAVRRQRRYAVLATVSTSIALTTAGLAIYAESQRRLAVEQRELADRSLDFLIGTFAIANPATENPRTITALTILERARLRATQDFSRDPQIGARLLRATGEINLNLGLHEEAERDLTAALEREAASGEGRARTLLELATLAYSRSDADASRRYVDAASQSYDPNASYAPMLDVMVQEQRGNAAYLAGDYASAANLYRTAATGLAQLEEPDREKLAELLMRQATALTQNGHFAQADAIYGEALRLTAAEFGMSDVRTARAIHNRALARFEAGNSSAALAMMQQALSIYSQVLESDHPSRAQAELLMGRIASASGDHDRALAAFARAERIYAGLYGRRNPAVGDVAFFAAEANGRAGRVADALAHAARAKSIYDEHYGPDDPDQAEVLLLRARILAGADRHIEAHSACRQALLVQQRIEIVYEEITKTAGFCDDLRGSAG